MAGEEAEPDTARGDEGDDEAPDTDRTSLRPLVVYGAGGHGRVVADAALANGREVAGFIDDTRALGWRCPEGMVLGPGTHVHQLPEPMELVVALGDNMLRKRLVRQLLAGGRALTSVVHPRAAVAASACLGVGGMVLAQAVINAGAVLEEGCIVNSGAVVEHGVHVGAFCHIAPGAVVLGDAVVGEGVQVGARATVLPGVKLGAYCCIGAGAVVTRDVPPSVTCMGVPARVRGS